MHNGDADPDYLGQEVKQYGINDLTVFKPQSPVTLRTPEPTGHIYRSLGIAVFQRVY